ncbi:hypothetical protein B296_00053448 [Ensete ventricosum]|uniref:Uncharacterized protein n=1 Tax=Ensete ventricosum TaxID=4639 RepID=A0A426X0D1_ENSVE|nr:hypothetical protein B296_00053448 [Ensete ventricosum]
MVRNPATTCLGSTAIGLPEPAETESEMEGKPKATATDGNLRSTKQCDQYEEREQERERQSRRFCSDPAEGGRLEHKKGGEEAPKGVGERGVLGGRPADTQAVKERERERACELGSYSVVYFVALFH